MSELSELNDTLSTCSFVESWMVWVELSDREDESVRQAVVEAVGLEYGPYEGVAFESGPGRQFFRPAEGSTRGRTEHAIEVRARVLTFTITGSIEMLAAAVEAIRYVHSYEEPVIIVQRVMTSRSENSKDRGNPNRWWNRKPAI